MDEAAKDGSTGPSGPGLRCWLGRAFLAVLPLVLAGAGYYRQALEDRTLPQLTCDGDFYLYQLRRAAELGGRWWKVASDERYGWPYPTEAAKHAGLYEGVDLMALGAAAGTPRYEAVAVADVDGDGTIAVADLAAVSQRQVYDDGPLELVEASALDLQAAMNAGVTTSVAITQEYLDRIAAYGSTEALTKGQLLFERGQRSV